MSEKRIAIIVHGGAGDIPPDRHAIAQEGCLQAAAIGWEMLAQGASALDAVEAAVRNMEDNPAFNAGYGSVLNAAGEVEMDAGIMEGSGMGVGAVTLIKHFRHPITLARMVMETTPHHMLGGDGAELFARKQGCTPIPNESLITPRRLQQYQARTQAEGGDTVGAVALDAAGRLATANSTGGVSFKLPGRVGDSPLPGAGFYADDRFGAVATTGQGEHIMRSGLSFLVMHLLQSGMSAEEAAMGARALFLDRAPGGRAGWIVLDPQGGVGISHTTDNLSFAWRVSGMVAFASGIAMKPPSK